MQAANTRIEVRACKYDGLLHRTWPAELVRQDGSLIVVDAKFPEEIVHESLGTIAAGTHSVEYYWLDRWYNIFRFSEPNGDLRNYYCNVNVPPTFDGRTLTYVDLDMDILVRPDFSYSLLDLEEFEAHAETYRYPAYVQSKAGLAVNELVELIKKRQFPFNLD